MEEGWNEEKREEISRERRKNIWGEKRCKERRVIYMGLTQTL
jgi:hypothetical protein